MKFYMIAIRDDGEFMDIRKMDNGECIMPTERVKQLKAIECEYEELKSQIKVDEFKPHYQPDPIKYAVHILKGYLRAYLEKNTTKSTGIVEKRMLVVAFCHRIEEGLIDYLDKLEEFNS